MTSSVRITLQSTIFFVCLLATLRLGAQCDSSTQPITTGRMQTGKIYIDTSGFDQIPTAQGKPSALDQTTRAVQDLNSALSYARESLCCCWQCVSPE